jgi:serine phosphatase RsbU (regulator of sigma subunit)
MPDRERIVIIDDNANDLAVTRRFLERKGYAVTTATSGEEGLQAALRVTPDAFVVDYRMPAMDGFEVTRRIKSDPQLKNIPVLMLTGADAPATLVEGLGVGADDYMTKVSDLDVLFARVQALLRVKKYQDELRKFREQTTRDLQIARRVQEALVPQGIFRGPRIEIRSAYLPSETLSGDFYDYFQQDGTTYLFVADVSGHGLPAAILVSLLKSYIHTEADAKGRLSDFMSRLNDFLFSVSLPAQFATAQLFRLDGEGNLSYSNAAHPPFLLFQRAQHKTLILEQPSYLLGAMPQMKYDDQTLKVEPGDALFAYTDGLTDRRDRGGTFYDINRVAAILEASGDRDLTQVYDDIYADITRFAATDEYRDDIAFVLTQFQ